MSWSDPKPQLHSFSYPKTLMFRSYGNIFNYGGWCTHMAEIVHNQEGKGADDTFFRLRYIMAVVGIACYFLEKLFRGRWRQRSALIKFRLAIQSVWQEYRLLPLFGM